MTEHEEILELLALAAAGALDPHDMTRMNAHISGCETCRREFETWSGYAQAFRSLRPPVLPDRLMERTRTRIMAEQAARADQRSEGMLLAVLAGFGWIVAITIWFLFRLFTGGAVAVMETGVTQLLVWSAGSTLFVWLTAAVAALTVGSRRQVTRRAL